MVLDRSCSALENSATWGMISTGGGAEEASRARVRSAWAKFHELAPILTARGASFKVKGKIYRAYVQSVLVYGSET